MADNIEQKLQLLSQAYAKSLPLKIEEMQKSWEKYLSQPNAEQLKSLHILAHNLHGSSGSYGYSQLSQMTAQLENYFDKLLVYYDAEIIKHIQTLLQYCYAASRATPKIRFEIPHKVDLGELEKTVYICQFKQKSIEKIIDQLKIFGYQVTIVSEVQACIEILKTNNFLVMIFDLADIDDKCVPYLENRYKNNLMDHSAIYFIANTGEFFERLQALHWGGIAYFKSPVIFDDLAIKIENIIKEKTSSYRILIVEDDLDVAAYYSAILTEAGMETQLLKNLFDIERELVEYHPDVILMDIYMPDCNGLELATIIRQQEAYEGIPILFLSAEENLDKKSHYLTFGADEFISKNSLPKHLIQAIKQKALRYKIIREMLEKDRLTTVYNRMAITRILSSSLKLAQRNNMVLSIAIFDLDHFKNINDTYGHSMGDQVLKHFSLMMHKRLRESDSFGRYGGEEFMAILPNTRPEVAQKLINELRQQFHSFVFTQQNKSFNVSFSTGITSSESQTTESTLIKAADEALYIAKKNGRNQIIIAK